MRKVKWKNVDTFFLFWLDFKVRKVEENWQKSWAGSSMSSRSWTKIVRTGKAGQCLMNCHHGNHCFDQQCKWTAFCNRASLELLLIFQKWLQEGLTFSGCRLSSISHSWKYIKWGYIFCESFLLVIYMYTGQNIFLATVVSHKFMELERQDILWPLIASNTSHWSWQR